MPTAGAACALQVIGRERRHIAHEHRIELSNVYAEFERRRADETIQPVAAAFEEKF
jgi:hypothetical protein